MRNALLVAFALTCLTLPAQATEFDGTDHYEINASYPVTTAPFTVAAWVRPDHVDAALQIWGLGGTGLFNFTLRGDLGGDVLDFTANTGSEAALTSNGFVADEWVLVVGIAESTSSRIAVLAGDWANRGTNGSSQAFSAPTRNRIAGPGGVAAGNRFDGDIAYLTVWDVALDQQRVEALAARLHPVAIRPLAVVHYPLAGNGPVGTRARDMIGAGTMTAFGDPTKGELPLLHGLAPRYGMRLTDPLQLLSHLHRFTRCRLEEPSYALAA